MAEPERLIELSADFLKQRDLPNCRKHALMALKLSPNEPSAEKILAIADVIGAGDRRVGRHRDWYSVLQIRRGDEAVTVRENFKRLLLLVSPENNQLAFSREAYYLVLDAWAVLSSPERKAKYDAEMEMEETFWTACPYCFYVYEYAKVYEDCCLRCQNCRRPFHAAAMAEPPPSGGKEAYLCTNVYFPLGGRVCENKGGGGDAFVVISDDESCDKGSSNGDGNGNGKGGKSESKVGAQVKESNGDTNCGMSEGKVMERKGKRVKTVARNSKKIMGNGRLSNVRKQSPGRVVNGSGSGSECDLSTLKFMDGEDDIIIGLWPTS